MPILRSAQPTAHPAWPLARKSRASFSTVPPPEQRGRAGERGRAGARPAPLRHCGDRLRGTRTFLLRQGTGIGAGPLVHMLRSDRTRQADTSAAARDRCHLRTWLSSRDHHWSAHSRRPPCTLRSPGGAAFAVATTGRPRDAGDDKEGAEPLLADASRAGVSIPILAVRILDTGHLRHGLLSRSGRASASCPGTGQNTGANEA
jgi:hypothetical protein